MVVMKLVRTVELVTICSPGAWCEFEASIGCYEGSEHLPLSQIPIYRVKGGEWQLIPPFPFGSAFQVVHTTDPL